MGLRQQTINRQAARTEDVYKRQVDDRVAQPQTGIGFFFLKGNDAVIVGVNGLSLIHI